QSMTKVADNFITDGTESEIKVPFGIAVNSANGDFFVTDARNYVTPGRLHCYSAEGVLRWSVRTGDIPAVIAFTGSRRE
ncbi:MAG: YncE family protein, partial [Muribaculaceae bacterium]|nr:YncE family protein [Muribaculaceae bacterium]